MSREDVREVLVLLASVFLIVAVGVFAVKVLFAQRGLSVLCVP